MLIGVSADKRLLEDVDIVDLLNKYNIVSSLICRR